ncbi:hypothetical protein, partial [Lactococcus petauri]|uniref:hypothetical protein n=1 Tax=Lactococcus petauri TaxID=1940789 RepID=UPI0021F0FF41
RTVIETYGIAVRAGVITPIIDDEIKMRELMGLPPVTDAIRKSWADSGGIRAPVTLAKDGPPAPAPQTTVDE